MKIVAAGALFSLIVGSALAGEVDINHANAITLLRCFHPGGGFQSVRVIEAPWREADQFSAKNSTLIEITFTGEQVARPFQIRIGVIERDRFFRSVLRNDNDPIPPKRDCSLTQWQLIELNRTNAPTTSPP
jgi:hypothetical protein